VQYNFDKIKLVSVDFSVRGMGLSADIRETLHREVHIVFHAAASIKFNETFSVAVKNNTRLTEDMVILAQGIRNLEV